MAKQKGNVVTHGLRGKVGDLLVFRQRNGETVVSKIPELPKKVTEGQKKHQKFFQQATIYGKSVVADPQLKELYEAAAKKKKGITAYNVAVADFLNAPDIENVDLSAYNGAAGDEIRIIASDDFAVKSVHVSINNVDGTLIEEGYASQNVGNLWIYVASKNNDSTTGDRIVVTASDIPGNITAEERSL
jgi:signal peptidase I